MIQIAKKNGIWVVLINDEFVHAFDHIKNNLTNNFINVSKFLDEMVETDSEFTEWFSNFFTEYVSSSYDSEIFIKNVDKFLLYSDKYINSKNVDYAKFVDKTKKNNTSILFDEKDIRAISLSSTALKLYSIFWYDTILRLPDNIHRIVYNELIKPCVELKTTDKIYQIIKSRTCRSYYTDKYMWNIIKLSLLESPENYTMLVFNYLMSSLFATLNPESNPIPFIVGVVDESIGWLLSSVYNKKIIYNEAFAGSDEIYGSGVHQNQIKIMCCNDTVGKASRISLEIVESSYGLDEEQLEKFRDRIEKVNMIYPYMKRLNMMILSEVLDIPFSFLEKSSPKHLILCGILMYECAKGIFDYRYPILMEYLLCCPEDSSIIAVKSSYRIKQIKLILNENEKKTFGFPNRYFRYLVLSSICGILNASKRNLVYMTDGSNIVKFNYLDLEEEVVSFFTDYYSGNLKEDFQKMRIKLDKYFT